MLEHQRGGAKFRDISDNVGQIALQGPKARRILGRIAGEEVIPEKYYSCIFEGEAAGIRCVISRTVTPARMGLSCIWRPGTRRRCGKR